MRTHLCPHALELPGFLAPFRGNDAGYARHLTDERMVALDVKLGIGQHTVYGRYVTGLLKQRTQRCTVIGRTRLGDLREDDPPRQINHDNPLEPVPPGESLPSVTRTIDEESGTGQPL